MNLGSIANDVRKASPLVHCITNPISINQCANALLALGARPIMAEHPLEVREITKSASALMLNLGNITDIRIESIEISADAAMKNKIPFVLDLVGVSCSELRRDFARKITERYHPDIIKGNFSEIRALYDTTYISSGVDADKSLVLSDIVQLSASLAVKHSCVVLASGKEDIVTDGNCTLLIKNGCENLSRITGTGCMLGALAAAFLSVCPPLDAAVCACGFLGVCGELSKTEKGPGSFFVNLLDKLGTVTGEEIEKHMKTEEITL